MGACKRGTQTLMPHGGNTVKLTVHTFGLFFVFPLKMFWLCWAPGGVCYIRQVRNVACYLYLHDLL